MADIDLRKQRKEELLRKATGKAPLPPAAAPITFPLPPGKLVAAGSVPTQSLLPEEQAVLKEIGWQEGKPIPANMADIIAAATKKIQAEVDDPPPPVSLDTPPVRVRTVDIKDLSAAEQAEIRAKLEAALIAEREMKEAEAKKATQPRLSAEIQRAVDAAERVAASPKIEIVNDLADKPIATPSIIKPPSDDKSDNTGAELKMLHCPHCQWDLSITDDVEPSSSDKDSYVHSLLGGKSWLKSFGLYKGKLLVTFRTLMADELDAIYQQVQFESRARPEQTTMDFVETVNRYRLCLQLQSLKGDDVHHDLPAGLNTDTNPNAQSHWQADPDENNPTALPQIVKYLKKTVLTTESLYRVIALKGAEFNRLFAKMEVMADSPDF